MNSTTTTAEIADRITGVWVARRITGVWVARTSDGPAVVFPTELQALRYAVINTLNVAFVPWGADALREGEDVRDA